MARIRVDDDTVWVELTRFEKVMAMRASFRFDRSLVERAVLVESPLKKLRGLRAPGLGLPGVAAIGTWRHGEGADFVAVRSGERGVLVELAEGAPFRRLLLGTSRPEQVAASLRPARV